MELSRSVVEVPIDPAIALALATKDWKNGVIQLLILLLRLS